MILLQLFEEGVEFGVLAVGQVADAVGLCVGLAFDKLLGGFGVGEDVAGLQLRLAFDLGCQEGALALVIGHFLGSLTLDAGEDRVADFGGMASPPKPNVHQLDAIVPLRLIAEAAGRKSRCRVMIRICVRVSNQTVA